MNRSLAPSLSVLALAFGASQLRRVLTTPPPYEVERRDGALEVRRYRARIVARTTVDRALVAALHEGDARLGPLRLGEPITATPAVDAEGEGGYVVAVAVPGYREPPRPADTRVKFAAVPARRVATLRFRGAVGVGRIRLMRDRLLAAVDGLGLATNGETSFATYDAPGSLPVLRRNEVWVELAAAAAEGA